MRRPLAIGIVALAAGVAIVGLWWRGRVLGVDAGESAASRRVGWDRVQAEARGTARAESGAASREAASTPADTNIRTLRLVRESGEPVAGAALAAFADSTILGEATTDAAGEATFPPLADGTQLWVVAAGHLACALAVPAPPARDVTLPRGNVVSGVALVDDAPPAAPLLFDLHADRPMFNLPTRALAMLQHQDWSGASLQAGTGPGGAFAFEGLPADFAGTLSINSWDLVIVGKRSRRRTMRLERPEPNLVIRLAHLPKITGRIVDPTNHEPVPNLGLFVELEESGTDSTFGACNTESDGRFTWEVGSIAPFVFRAWTDAPSAVHPVVERAIESARDVDLGDIPYIAKRKVVLEVVDASGSPIAGAVAAAGWEESLPSGAAGRIELRCSGLARECTIGVVGYLASRVSLPEGDDVSRRVILDAGTVVDVTVAVPDFEKLRGGFVRAISPTFLFVGDRTEHHPSEIRAGAGNLINCKRSETGSEASCQFFTTAPVRWNGLRPGVPITFELIPRIGDPLASATVTLEPGEHRAVELRANPRIRILRGIVVDRDGNAIRGVSAKVQRDPHLTSWNTADTDDRGAFGLAPLFGDEVFLSLEKPAYVPFARIVKTQSSEDEEPLRIVLEAGRIVRVSAEDARGREVPIDSVRAERAGIPNIPGVLEESVWLVKNAPDGEATFVLTAAGREWRSVRDSREGAVKFVLPEPGAVALTLAKKHPKGAVILVSIAVAGAEGELEPRERGVAPNELRFPAVAPGTYDLRVRIAPSFGQAVDPKDLSDTKKTIEVRSGETTSVTWDGAFR